MDGRPTCAAPPGGQQCECLCLPGADGEVSLRVYLELRDESLLNDCHKQEGRDDECKENLGHVLSLRSSFHKCLNSFIGAESSPMELLLEHLPCPSDVPDLVPGYLLHTNQRDANPPVKSQNDALYLMA